ncbi:MAG: hypothetical protein IAE99_13080 [Rhodothermales bacterium]|nr:hypothetical protein [Rhodothermales bacterium]
MLVRNIATSTRFYTETLGFGVVLRDAKDGAWALLRRGDAELLLEDRACWPETTVPLGETGTGTGTGTGTLALVFDGEDEDEWTNPEGVRVVVTDGVPIRRRAA